VVEVFPSAEGLQDEDSPRVITMNAEAIDEV
jgi:hypothetical protein